MNTRIPLILPLASILFLLIFTTLLSASHINTPTITIIDADKNGADSPGDELIYGNNSITLRFRFVNLSSERRKVDAKFNGWFIDSVTYRGENAFSILAGKRRTAFIPLFCRTTWWACRRS